MEERAALSATCPSRQPEARKAAREKYKRAAVAMDTKYSR
jgi:hypothetical protein